MEDRIEKCFIKLGNYYFMKFDDEFHPILTNDIFDACWFNKKDDAEKDCNMFGGQLIHAVLKCHSELPE